MPQSFDTPLAPAPTNPDRRAEINADDPATLRLWSQEPGAATKEFAARVDEGLAQPHVPSEAQHIGETAIELGQQH